MGQRDILAVMRRQPDKFWTTEELVEATNRRPATVHSAVLRLQKKGEIEPRYEKWGNRILNKRVRLVV